MDSSRAIFFPAMIFKSPQFEGETNPACAAIPAAAGECFAEDEACVSLDPSDHENYCRCWQLSINCTVAANKVMEKVAAEAWAVIDALCINIL